MSSSSDVVLRIDFKGTVKYTVPLDMDMFDVIDLIHAQQGLNRQRHMYIHRVGEGDLPLNSTPRLLGLVDGDLLRIAQRNTVEFMYTSFFGRRDITMTRDVPLEALIQMECNEPGSDHLISLTGKDRIFLRHNENKIHDLRQTPHQIGIQDGDEIHLNVHPVMEGCYSPTSPTMEHVEFDPNFRAYEEPPSPTYDEDEKESADPETCSHDLFCGRSKKSGTWKAFCVRCESWVPCSPCESAAPSAKKAKKNKKYKKGGVSCRKVKPVRECIVSAPATSSASAAAAAPAKSKKKKGKAATRKVAVPPPASPPASKRKRTDENRAPSVKEAKKARVVESLHSADTRVRTDQPAKTFKLLAAQKDIDRSTNAKALNALTASSDDE